MDEVQYPDQASAEVEAEARIAAGEENISVAFINEVFSGKTYWVVMEGE